MCRARNGMTNKWVIIEAGNTTLRVTPSHLVFIMGNQQIKQAQDLDPGHDYVQVKEDWHIVTNTNMIFDPSSFTAPLTSTGSLIVNDIYVSTFAQLPSFESLLFRSAFGLDHKASASTEHDAYVDKVRLLIKFYHLPLLGPAIRSGAKGVLQISHWFWKFWATLWDTGDTCAESIDPVLEYGANALSCILPAQPVPDLNAEPLLELLRSSGHQIVWMVEWYISLASWVSDQLKGFFNSLVVPPASLLLHQQPRS
eukprot:Blabericola_migrator_1__4206@NODE_228_length_11100_cov_168_633645_g194_i0_p5_GENE_NODE_228_length_11100_cov_168_633645_g194_i0NODE_228_length_11100_cov_168_633645_g194_i0_p5_ORF_typecomplete_len254_score30_79Hint/PF01079_20/1_3e10PTHINT/PF07591_11/0_018Intein_splicing/PF14890_6/0_076_NODE_228_length_11100_cov_168_633645_g194_i067157476